jgi:hypothetical protein
VTIVKHPILIGQIRLPARFTTREYPTTAKHFARAEVATGRTTAVGMRRASSIPERSMAVEINCETVSLVDATNTHQPSSRYRSGKPERSSSPR